MNLSPLKKAENQQNIPQVVQLYKQLGNFKMETCRHQQSAYINILIVNMSLYTWPQPAIFSLNLH